MRNSTKIRTNVISEASLEFLAESSSFGFFKHDIKKGVFYLDNKLRSVMGISSDILDVPEVNIMSAWGDNLYKKYIHTVTNNFNFKNYKYTADFDFERDGNIAHSKIHIVLFADDKGELAFVEAIYSNFHIEENTNNTSSLFNEDQFRQILNNINSLVFIVDTDYNIVDYNNEGEKIFSSSNQINKKCIPLNKYFDFSIGEIETILKTGKPLAGYKTLFVADHMNTRNYIFNIAKISLLNRSSYLVFSGIDITETLVLENQLLINELKFRSLVEQSPLGINIYDNNAILLETNKAAIEILEIPSKEALLGANIYECYDLSQAEIAQLERGEVLSFSKPFDFADITKRLGFKFNYDGVKYLEVILLKLRSDKNDVNLGYIEFISDKTYEHNALESLKKSSNQLSLATNTGNVGIFEINLVDRTYVADAKTISMFEDKSLGLKSQLDDFLKLIHPDDIEKIFNATSMLKRGESNSFSLESRIKHGEHDWKWIKTSASVIKRDQNDGVVRVVGVHIDIDDLKKAKEEAIKKESLLRQTLNIGEMGLWDYDAERDVISLGSSLENSLHFGYSSFGGRDFSAEQFFDIIDLKDKDKIMLGYSEIFSGNKDSLTSECRLGDSYDNLWVSLTAFVNERDSNGRPLKMNGSIMNINEKVFALEETKKMEYCISTSLEIARVGYLYKYFGEKKLDISDSCCEIYCMNKEGIGDLDYFIKNRIHPKDRRKYKRFAAGFENNSSNILKDINYRVIIDGEIRRFHAYVTVRYDNQNKALGTLYAFQDVTDLYETEVRLQGLLDSQRFVAEISVMMMSVVDPAEMLEKLLLSVKARMKGGNISYYKKNDTSYELKKTLGNSDYPILDDSDNIINENDVEYVIEKIKNNTPILLDSSEGFASADPSIDKRFFIPGSSTLFLPVIVRNALYGFITLSVDTRLSKISYDDFSLMKSFIQIVNLAFEKLDNHTQLLAAKNKAEEADKLKTAFLANMSHEIRTPLNSVVGFSQLIAEAARDDEDEIVEYVTVLNRNTDQLLSIVNNVIDFSEVESSSLFIKPELASVEKMFDKFYDSCMSRAHDKLEVICSKPSGDEVFLNSDLLRVRQILKNLINNAFKYTQEGVVEYGYESMDDGVLFHVFDTGIGIKDEDKEKIFERFFQADTMVAGTGLGLCIVKAIVDELKGRMRFESKEGEGAKFYIFIPNFKE